MRTYNSYHSHIKQLARFGKLPLKYSDNIDRSTIWRWRQEQPDKYIGHELSDIEYLQAFLERNEAERVIRNYLRIAMTLSSILRSSTLLQNHLARNKAILVRTLLRYKKSIHLSTVLRILNISASTFHHWKNQVLFPCQSSVIKLCRRIYPNQLTQKETILLKQLITKPEFQYWPISSIAHYARRENILHTSLSSWYNYIHKLGLKRQALHRKQKYPIGIRASMPHQIWHADITIVKCLNGMKYYVYLLMDNYSRYILNYQVAERVSASIRLDSIRKAYFEYCTNQKSDTQILVDGGPENNNSEVDCFVNHEQISLKKLIAGKDILFSNSMVEAQNKLIKYYYLFKHQFENINDLNKLLDWIVKDFNHKRPHHSLKGLTPAEALSNQSPPNNLYREQTTLARKTRILENSSESCGIC